MRFNNIIKYIMVLSIIIILISGLMLAFERMSFEDEKIQKIEDSKEIQKYRHTILEVNNSTAKVDGGKTFKISDEAKKQMILKKASNVYINTSSNEIVKIEFEEYIR